MLVLVVGCLLGLQAMQWAHHPLPHPELYISILVESDCGKFSVFVLNQFVT